LHTWCWDGALYTKARERAKRLRAAKGHINEIELGAIVDAIKNEQQGMPPAPPRG
jgi:hypothetical protein